MDSTLSQGYSLLIFLYGGIVLGIIWDALRFVRRRFRGAAVFIVCDLLFSAVFLAVTAITFFLATNGVLRLYGALCMALGMHIAHRTLGRFAQLS